MSHRVILPSFLFVALPIFVLGQAAPPAAGEPPASTATLPPETVIATIDGYKLTAGELDIYLNELGPEKKAAALANRRELINQLALQRKLVELAEKEKLDQKSPYKEALDVGRRGVLMEAELNYKSLSFPVTVDDQKKFYESHKDRYNDVKVQIIYVGFTSDEVAKENPKKYRNEADALALAKKIRSEAKNEAEWRRLVLLYSEDGTTKDKFGEYGVISFADQVPPEIHDAVFKLKREEVSPPVKQQNGFYLFRAQSIGMKSFEQVKDDIYTELKNTRLTEWVQQTQKQISIKLENDEFFRPSATPKL